MRNDMYVAEADKVYVDHPDGRREHFITIHPTDTGGTVTVEKQAITVAKMLNEYA